MKEPRRPTGRSAAVLCAAALLLLTVPLTGAKGSNADNAKACQKGGWEQLATSDQPFTPFANEQACTSAGARGGTLVPRASLTMVVSLNGFLFMGRSLCWAYPIMQNVPASVTSITFTTTLNDGRQIVEVVPQTSRERESFYATPEKEVVDVVAIVQPGGYAVPVTVIDTCGAS